jgi:hypothetical protein
MTLVEAGQLTPTLAEGLRAQEIIDRRQEKNSDRELTLALAGILGGSPIIEGSAFAIAVDDGVERAEELPVQGQDILLHDHSGLREMAQESTNRVEGSQSV